MTNEYKEYKDTSVVILAAGNSLRMGSPKFMLKFDSTYTFLEKIIEGYKNFGCKEIIIVLNPEGAKLVKQSESIIADNQKIVINIHPEKERFLSIQTGLKALNKPSLVFIHPADNPFVNQEVLQLLVDNCEKSDYQAPMFCGKGGHPILISKNLHEEICISSDINVNFKLFLNGYSKTLVNTNSPEVLININTLDDYKSFIKKQADS